MSDIVGGGMSDRPPLPDIGLRDRIAKAIWRTFQNTPPIEATDEEWENWWGLGTELDQKLYYMQADAVIAELQPVLEAEYDRGYNEGLDWLNDERRWIKEDDDEKTTPKLYGRN